MRSIHPTRPPHQCPAPVLYPFFKLSLAPWIHFEIRSILRLIFPFHSVVYESLVSVLVTSTPISTLLLHDRSKNLFSAGSSRSARSDWGAREGRRVWQAGDEGYAVGCTGWSWGAGGSGGVGGRVARVGVGRLRHFVVTWVVLIDGYVVGGFGGRDRGSGGRGSMVVLCWIRWVDLSCWSVVVVKCWMRLGAACSYR
jgi:hypothetical protein